MHSGLEGLKMKKLKTLKRIPISFVIRPTAAALFVLTLYLLYETRTVSLLVVRQLRSETAAGDHQRRAGEEVKTI